MSEIITSNTSNSYEIYHSNFTVLEISKPEILLTDFVYLTNDEREMNHYDFIPAYFAKVHRKETFLVTAVKNLRRKVNFIMLNNEFQNGDISDVEFEKEIENHPDKYVVKVNHINCDDDLEALHEVIMKVNEDFSIDEISEIFSVDITGVTIKE